MSYDLRVVGPLDEARAAALLAEAGAEGEGGELHLVLDGVAASFLVAGGEVGVGMTTLTDDDAVARAGFRRALDVVLALGQELGAPVYDPQADRELTPAGAEEALRAFG